MPEKDRPEDTPQGKVEMEAVQPVDSSQPGTVHHTLARLREARRYEPPAEPEAPEEGEEKASEAPVPEREEPVPETEPGEAAPTAPGTQTPPSGEGQKFKYKSHEEAERAYREAERRMHQATTEKAALQKELEELKARLAALEEERQGKPAPPPDKEEALARLVELNTKIDDLDPYDPDYARQKAELELEKAFILDAVKGSQAIPSPEAVKDLVRQELAAREQEMARSRELEELERRVTRLAESYGLDMKPGSWDYKHFWRAVRAGDVPEGDGIGLEDQVKALAEEILADKAGFGQKAVQNMKRIHEENAPLGRGGTGPPAGPEHARPRSIHEILAANRRRI